MWVWWLVVIADGTVYTRVLGLFECPKCADESEHFTVLVRERFRPRDETTQHSCMPSRGALASLLAPARPTPTAATVPLPRAATARRGRTTAATRLEPWCETGRRTSETG